mmetsp:Transcript_12253/g.28594  ORF Transcript_12253/g.28594 Transcript_12253/m.28594 type:complete len:825 (+) Transcript_12253:103-2577(+)
MTSSPCKAGAHPPGPVLREVGTVTFEPPHSHSLPQPRSSAGTFFGNDALSLLRVDAAPHHATAAASHQASILHYCRQAAEAIQALEREVAKLSSAGSCRACPPPPSQDTGCSMPPMAEKASTAAPEHHDDLSEAVSVSTPWGSESRQHHVPAVEGQTVLEEPRSCRRKVGEHHRAPSPRRKVTPTGNATPRSLAPGECPLSPCSVSEHSESKSSHRRVHLNVDETPVVSPTGSTSSSRMGCAELVAQREGMCKSKSNFRLARDLLRVQEEQAEQNREGASSCAFESEFALELSLARLQSQDMTVQILGSDLLSRYAPQAGAGCVMHPCSNFRLTWDLAAAAFVLYDAFALPLTVFEMPDSIVTRSISTAAVLYWTFDLPLNFFVGFHLADGDVERRWKRVARRYCCTWLPLDAIILLMEWWATLSQTSFGSSLPNLFGSGYARLIKGARFLRFLRLLKMSGARRRIHDSGTLHAYFGAQRLTMMVKIAFNLFSIVWFNHCIAAAWFALGRQEAEGGWMASALEDIWYRSYLRALQFAISNFTPGGSDVQPRTTPEVAFHVIVLFLALVVFSVFVSSTTSLISELVRSEASRTQKLLRLKRFMFKNKFPAELWDTVYRHAVATYHADGSDLSCLDDETLMLLPKPLQQDVYFFLHKRAMCKHPLIVCLSASNAPLLRTLCTDGVLVVLYNSDVEVFFPGQLADGMSFIAGGVMRYNKCVLQDSNDEWAQVQAGDWFCEAALWTRWHCRGVMATETDCQTLKLRREALNTALALHPMSKKVVREYAIRFVDDLNIRAFDEAASCKLSDLATRSSPHYVEYSGWNST